MKILVMGKPQQRGFELCILSSIRGSGRAYLFSEIGAPSRRASLAGVALTKNDPTLGEIIGRHFEMHPVANHRANAKFAHLAGRVGDNLVLVIKPDGKASMGRIFSMMPSIARSSSFAKGFESRKGCRASHVTL